MENKDYITVCLSSESFVKMTAVETAFAELFPNVTIVYTSVPAASMIANQPVKKEYGLLGANNRLQKAKEYMGEYQDYWVSIESFIDSEGKEGNEKWFDQAVVIIQKGSSDPVAHFSEKTYFNPKFQIEAEDRNFNPDISGYSVTIGEIIREDFARKGVSIPADNWHNYFGVSRVKLIKDTIKI